MALPCPAEELAVRKCRGKMYMSSETILNQRKIAAVFFTTLASLTMIAAAVMPAIA